MRGKNPWRNIGLVILALAVSSAGCAQTPTFLQEDGAAYQRHEQMIMSPEPSGQSTEGSLYMDMEGGG